MLESVRGGVGRLPVLSIVPAGQIKVTVVSRPALDVAALRTRVDPAFVASLDVVADTASTNADLLRAAATGAPAGTVLVAEWQHAGRGRFDRSWVSPPRAGLTFSMLLRPEQVRPERWGWLPLLAGASLCVAVRSLLPAGADVALKWPNDLLVGGRKAAGILAEAASSAVVVGMGVNVDHGAEELPASVAATSLALTFPDAPVDRGRLLIAVLSAFAERYAWWCAAGDDTRLIAEYAQLCATIGSDVQVTTAGETFTAYAVSVDEGGRLVLKTATGPRVLSAADIAHVRPRM